jgi:hypothetical protein
MTINSIYQKPTGAKTQNTDWITDATPITEAGTLILQISLETAVVVEITLDGTNYELINTDGAALTAKVLHRFEIDVDNTMTFNIRTPDAAGVTIRKVLIKEIPVAYAN